MSNTMPFRGRRTAVLTLLAAVAATSLPCGAARAGGFPEKPIVLLVPYAPGGTTDIIGRFLARGLSTQLGQPVIVENRAGAGGMVGALALARANPDGYTLGVATVSTLATAPLTSRRPSYDPLKDFTPISLIAAVPNVMTVYPGVPAKTLQDFVKLVKDNPGKYSYASSGVGSIAHLDGELFKSLAGVDMVHVPYRGSGPALNDTAAGQVAAQFDNLSSSLPFIKAGKLRALAVAADKRVADLPDVPTYAEAGMPEMNNMAWFGLVGPRDMPAPIRDALAKAVADALAQPEMAQRLQSNGAYPKATSPAGFEAIIQREYALRKRIVDERHISAD